MQQAIIDTPSGVRQTAFPTPEEVLSSSGVGLYRQQNYHLFRQMISLIELRDIREDNSIACLNLKASVEHEDFVDSVAYSLAEA